ncbi:putative DsbA family dithiol-disulfide isomerase [Rhodovulum imhoffii]|uniref:Putative DsbA family dithiol-disulfide isomerase n=1 Tax=Rhodovulum imhoffii TaxID=365340 RepID=A0A2T5BTR2_9RHOB|nr:DsbA family oxidoreductase [Rhodovulum imhoffii]MBK5934106.1 polyketide biosynthesis protein [Rhodovulum imhoffii]PTN02821.1 putative DsbA family dithiol-disulfide isomerase [Rhodovulum imhoffii]
MIALDIFADPICPWCLIGKRRLDAALATHPDHPFTIAWHPFQLNPAMPASGMDRADYLTAKFGSRENAVKVYSEIDHHARQDGLKIDWSRITRTPNTLDAHRLLHWAGIEGRQQAVMSFLLEGYFLNGTDIGTPEALTAIAQRAGMDGTVVARLLDGEADKDTIRNRDSHARQRGITGVPTFIVANTHVLSGAQPTVLWEQVIAELTAPPGQIH